MAVVVSAPGKVLITGGYLVLEQPNAGLVLSTSARFFAIVKPLHAAVETNSWAWSWADVKVMSPQLSKEMVYKLSLRNFTLQRVSPLSDDGNAFVEEAVQLAVATARVILQEDEDQCDHLLKLLRRGFQITILGSNDFYSFRKQVVGEPGTGGSHTPSMVGAVQRWRKNDSERSPVLWSQLAQANIDVERWLLQLKQIADFNWDKYKEAIEFCKGLSARQWTEKGAGADISQEVVSALLGTRQAFLNVRSILRQLGDAAGVPIEPPSQSALLDATMDIEGVLLAGVPGAGGYDAVFAITLDNNARRLVENEWSSKGVLALCVVEDSNGVQLEEGDPRQDEAMYKMGALKLT